MPSSINMENTEWVFISATSTEADQYSAARPPQHKQSTMSSAQVANTQAAPQMRAAELDHAVQIELTMAMDMMVLDGCYDPTYPIDHKPPSNISQGTQNTITSGATALGNLFGADLTFTSPGYGYGLTKNILQQHQQQLDSLNPGDIRAWLDGASPTFARHAVSSKQKTGGGGHFYGGGGRSKPSNASDGSYVVVSDPDEDATLAQDIRAAGALFNEQCINPFIYTSPYLEMEMDM